MDIAESVYREINDPTSEYYIGQPSTLERIHNMVSGRYNTHYFGRNAGSFLAQPQNDTLQILYNARENQRRNTMFKLAAGTAITAVGLAVCRKIPVLNLIPRFLGYLIGIRK